MALLGLIGVMLSLILTGLAVGHVGATTLAKVLGSGSVALLLVASAFISRALWLQKVALPGVDDLRRDWEGYKGGVTGGNRARGSIANSFLAGPPGRDPINTAKADADARARWLKCGLLALFVAFAMLTALVIQIVVQV